MRVSAQGVQLADLAAGGDGFEVGVARDEQGAVPGLEQVGDAWETGLGRAGDRAAVVRLDLDVALVEEERHAGRGFRTMRRRGRRWRSASCPRGRGGVVARGPDGLTQALRTRSADRRREAFHVGLVAAGAERKAARARGEPAARGAWGKVEHGVMVRAVGRAMKHKRTGGLAGIPPEGA